MSNELFQIGDTVYYTGSRFKSKLNGKKGFLHARVENQPGLWCVEFPDSSNRKEDPTDTDDYIMSVRVLTKGRPTAVIEKEKKAEGPEVQPRRKRRNEEEES